MKTIDDLLLTAREKELLATLAVAYEINEDRQAVIEKIQRTTIIGLYNKILVREITPFTKPCNSHYSIYVVDITMVLRNVSIRIPERFICGDFINVAFFL